MSGETDVVAAERERVQAEYQRRAQEVDRDLYAPWHPAEMLMRSGRKRVAAAMLHQAGVFPKPGDPCLEVGFGELGWLGEMISWGVRETDLHGIELDEMRTKRAKEILPIADLRVGDATALSWEDNTFRLVIVSTVLTSILDSKVRRLVADEITRVLAPGGALLWYDFVINNPKNPHVRKVGRSELQQLFPQCNVKSKPVTLAPPLARLVAPRSWAFANVLETIPPLCSHLLAVLVKRP